jgi:hypothetical protein
MIACQIGIHGSMLDEAASTGARTGSSAAGATEAVSQRATVRQARSRRGFMRGLPCDDRCGGREKVGRRKDGIEKGGEWLTAVTRFTVARHRSPSQDAIREGDRLAFHTGTVLS